MEVSLNREGGGGGGGNSSKGGGDAFIDRSKVRILVCDNDAKSLEEVSTLLLKCSYQGIYIITYIAFFFFFFSCFDFLFLLNSMICIGFLLKSMVCLLTNFFVLFWLLV